MQLKKKKLNTEQSIWLGSKARVLKVSQKQYLVKTDITTGKPIFSRPLTDEDVKWLTIKKFKKYR